MPLRRVERMAFAKKINKRKKTNLNLFNVREKLLRPCSVQLS